MRFLTAFFMFLWMLLAVGITLWFMVSHVDSITYVRLIRGGFLLAGLALIFAGLWRWNPETLWLTVFLGLMVIGIGFLLTISWEGWGYAQNEYYEYEEYRGQRPFSPAVDQVVIGLRSLATPGSHMTISGFAFWGFVLVNAVGMANGVFRVGPRERGSYIAGLMTFNILFAAAVCMIAYFSVYRPMFWY